MNLRNRRSLVLPAALAVLQLGCNDILTESPRSVITTDSFFKTAADANAALAAAYQPLSSGDLFSTSLQWALNAADDESRVGVEEENSNITSLSRLAWDARNPYIAGGTSAAGAYAGLYRVITRSNLILEKVPDIQMDATANAQILAQAKFLRALSYLYLVRLYGDVPLVRTTDEQFSVTTRTPKDSVYAQIVKDATEAEAVLPAVWGASQKGQAPKAAANAVLAEMYIWRSTNTNDGPPKNEWAQAAAAAKKVIDSGVHSLVPNYLNAFLPGSQNRPEEIFAAQSSSATGAPAIDIAQWTWPRNLDPNSAGGWGTYQPLPWFIDSYIPGDYRKEVTFFTTGRTSTGTTVTFSAHINKYRPTVKPGRQDVNYPIYRYADVLLMYAEALNEQGQSAQALQLVNQVRARARNGTGSEARTSPADLVGLTQAQTREAIFQERMWELSFEGKRWFDMVRRGSAYFLAAEAKDPTVTDAKATDMVWPIPQAQIDLNKALTQNPGY